MQAKNIKVAVIFATGVIRPEILEILNAIPAFTLISHTCDPKSSLDSLPLTPDVVLVELSAEDVVPGWLEQLTQVLSPSAIILCSQHWQPDFLIQAAQAGLREFLTIPFTRADLEAVVRRIYFPRDLNQIAQGHVIVVTGYKGGVGVTTVAMNLAMALGEQTNHKVALVDLGRPFPDIAKFLDQKVTYSWSDIMKQRENVDEFFLKGIMQTYGPELDILHGCMDIEGRHNLKTDVLEHILKLLRHMYQYIVVDLGQVFDQLYVEAIKQSDMVILLSGLTIADLYNLNEFWHLLGDWAEGYIKIKVVVNRINKWNTIQLKRLEEITKSQPLGLLPSDYHLLMDALIQGNHLGVAAPHSQLWDKIRELAKKIHQEMEPDSEETEDKVSEEDPQGLSWLLPRSHRFTILGAFSLAILSLLILALNYLGTDRAPLPQTRVIKETKSAANEIGAVPSNLTAPMGPEVSGVKSPSSITPPPPEGSGKAAPRPAPSNLWADTSPPAPPAPPAEAVVAPPPEAEAKPQYVGSITSNKYHYPDCKWARTILPERLIEFKSVTEAQGKGYIPCPICTPPRKD